MSESQIDEDQVISDVDNLADDILVYVQDMAEMRGLSNIHVVMAVGTVLIAYYAAMPPLTKADRVESAKRFSAALVSSVAGRSLRASAWRAI